MVRQTLSLEKRLRGRQIAFSHELAALLTYETVVIKLLTAQYGTPVYQDFHVNRMREVQALSPERRSVADAEKLITCIEVDESFPWLRRFCVIYLWSRLESHMKATIADWIEMSPKVRSIDHVSREIGRSRHMKAGTISYESVADGLVRNMRRKSNGGHGVKAYEDVLLLLGITIKADNDTHTALAQLHEARDNFAHGSDHDVKLFEGDELYLLIHPVTHRTVSSSEWDRYVGAAQRYENSLSHAIETVLGIEHIILPE